MSKLQVAFAVQRYGLEVNGGAELHARLVAEHMNRHWEIQVLTSCALDYITWRDFYKKGIDRVNSIKILRFPVRKERNLERFARIQEKIFQNEHSVSDEIDWINENGPYCPDLIKWLEKHRNDFNYFIFFSYRYYHSYWGINSIPEKSILVPTAEHDEVLYMRVFRDIFKNARGIIYNSLEEKELINNISKNFDVPSDIVGLGINKFADINPERFRKKYRIEDEFIVYVGRIDENKGCKELFEYFLEYKKRKKGNVKLILIGSPVMRIPQNKDLIYLGFIPEEDKWDALAASSFLIMPSFYESLSIVTLEAWAAEKPVLVNGKCEVLKGQALRSNAGLFYTNYEEFEECMEFLLKNRDFNISMGKNGKEYYENNYRWEIIESKYLKLIERITET
ncbi:MAG: glycosyltransferase family 4 protein [Acidobacteriota bacterium]